jgi:hypothetical protein
MYSSVTTGAKAHDHLAGDHVRGDGAVRDRQPVEARLHAGTGHVTAQQVVDAVGIDDAARDHDPSVLEAKFEIVAVGDPGALLLDRLQVTLAEAADHGLPVDLDQEFLQLSGGNAGRITGADERAHARARDAVHGHVHFLEDLEHADVRAALGTAAGQYEADARPGRGRDCGARRWVGAVAQRATEGEQHAAEAPDAASSEFTPRHACLLPTR